jgi:hypothetical protein
MKPIGGNPMSSVPTSSPFEPQNVIPHQNGNGSNEIKEPPSQADLELEIIQPAREIFSGALFKEQGDYDDLDRTPLTEKCRKLLKGNIEAAKSLQDIGDVAHLIFNRYRDEAIESALAIYYQKNPNAKSMDEKIRKDLGSQARMLHSLVIKDPIRTVMVEAFPDQAETIEKLKIDLRKKKEI